MLQLRGQSILLFLDSQLTLELDRADVSQRRMTTLHVVVPNVLRDLPDRLRSPSVLHIERLAISIWRPFNMYHALIARTKTDPVT